MPKFCSNCGKEINENSKFCDNCGNQIIINRVQSQNISGYKIVMKSLKKQELKTCTNSFIITSVIVLIIAVLFTLLIYYIGKIYIAS